MDKNQNQAFERESKVAGLLSYQDIERLVQIRAEHDHHPPCIAWPKASEMADGLLDENKNTPNCEKDEERNEEEFSLRCGYRSWRPDFLQRFVNPKWFICALSLFSVTQGILVNGLTGVSIPDIEKEFGFSSSSAGIILASNDIAGIILVPLVSFWGTHGRKPKWIGIGGITTGLGALIYAFPKALAGAYNIPGTGGVKPFCLKDGTGNMCTIGRYSSSTLYLFILCLGQFVMGAGTTPLYTLGPAYMDENVNPKVSPIYLGIWFATTFLGPGLGYAVGGTFLRIFTDLKVPASANINPRDPRWVGAWWMGYFVFSWFLLLSGLVLLCFPKEMPRYKKKREQALKEGTLLQADAELGKDLRSFLTATLRLLKNPTFMFSVLGLTVRTLYGSAIGSFFAKIILLKFGGSTFEISIATGVVLLPGMAGGIMIGSFIMKKVPIKDSAKKAALICATLSLLTIGGSATFMIPGCRTTVMAGATTPYVNSTETGSLTAKCNAGCACSRQMYAPVCGTDGKSYFSPCHAGCQGAISKTSFIQCRCITGAPFRRHNSTNITSIDMMKLKAKQFQSGMVPFPNSSVFVNMTNMNSSRFNLKAEANFGLCDRDCKNATLFMGLCFLLILVMFLTATPQKLILLRCVPDNQRAFALGLQFLFMRSLSFIPGPVIFGAVIDSQCILWSKDNCGNRGNCLDYHVNSLSKNIFYLGMITASIGTVFYFMAWYFYKPLDTTPNEKLQYNAEDGLLLDETTQEKSDENGDSKTV